MSSRSPASMPMMRSVETVPGRSPVRLLLALLVALAALIAAPLTPAAAHDQLVDTVIEVPEADGPGTITLSYSNTLMDGATLVRVLDESGQSVTSGDPQLQGRDVVQALEPLAAGTYSAAWSVVSSDGHRIEGGFSFEISEGFSGETAALPLAEMPQSTDTTDDESGEHEHAEGDDHDHGSDGHDHDDQADDTAQAAAAGFPVWGWVVIAIIVVAAAVLIPIAVRASRRTATDPASPTPPTS